MDRLASFAGEQGIGSAELSGIGAFQRALVGFYDPATRDYAKLPVEEDTEVLSLLGNLSLLDEAPRVHLHATLSRRDGSTVGGHLFEGTVGATVELFVREEPDPVRRLPDEEIGIPLLDL